MTAHESSVVPHSSSDSAGPAAPSPTVGQKSLGLSGFDCQTGASPWAWGLVAVVALGGAVYCLCSNIPWLGWAGLFLSVLCGIRSRLRLNNLRAYQQACLVPQKVPIDPISKDEALEYQILRTENQILKLDACWCETQKGYASYHRHHGPIYPSAGTYSLSLCLTLLVAVVTIWNFSEVGIAWIGSAITLVLIGCTKAAHQSWQEYSQQLIRYRSSRSSRSALKTHLEKLRAQDCARAGS